MSPSRLFSAHVRTLSIFVISIALITVALICVRQQKAASTIGEPAEGSRHAMADDVQGVTPAATTFVVNNVGDQDDSNIGDGHCDIDGNLGNGDQCTLRAAVSEGKVGNTGHSINFKVKAFISSDEYWHRLDNNTVCRWLVIRLGLKIAQKLRRAGLPLTVYH